MRRQQKWLVICGQLLLVVASVGAILSCISIPQLVCHVPEAVPFVSFVDVDEDDPVIKMLSCKNRVLGIEDQIPETYLLPQWDVMEYREPDFVNP